MDWSAPHNNICLSDLRVQVFFIKTLFDTGLKIPYVSYKKYGYN